MQNKESDNHLDSDILQCRQDILQARNARSTPPAKKPPVSAKPDAVIKEPSPPPVESTKTAETIPEQSQDQRSPDVNEPPVTDPSSQPAPAAVQKPKIPSFEDLVTNNNNDGTPASIEPEEKQEIPVQQNIEEEPETAASDDTGQNERQIPKFDLAEQILAEHRKVAATRRKAPEPKKDITTKPAAGTVGQIISQTKKALTEREADKTQDLLAKPVPDQFTENRHKPSPPSQIITELVKRDIAKFCTKNSLQNADDYTS